MTNKDTETTPGNVSLKLTAMVGVLMLALGGAAIAGAGKMRGHMFDRLDANKDNQITQDEITPFTEKRFSRFDADGDGTVSTAEVDAHLKKHLERRRARLLERFDKDGNGSITQAEFSMQTAQMFERADEDQDGAISRAEADKLRKHMRGKWRRHMDEMDGPTAGDAEEN